MTQPDVVKRITVFLVGTFGLSAVLWVLISMVDAEVAPGKFLFVPLMWAPGLVALVTMFIFQRNLRGMGWKPGKPIYFLIAIALPLVYGTVIYGSVWLLGLGDIKTNALGSNFWTALLTTLTIGAIPAIIFATGEEIGWRGLLVPQLDRIHPFVRMALISGVIWGLWHVPVILFGGYNSGAPMWYAIGCFMVMISGASFAYGWIRLASKSIWPAVLMHGLHNTLIQGVMDVITVDSGNTVFFTTEFGLFMAIAGVVLAVIFWRIGVPTTLRQTQPGLAEIPQPAVP